MRTGANRESPAESASQARSLLRTRDFLVPYLAETQSIAGDQVGRVALSVLVFERTQSVAWTALTYALTFLPAILGGLVLGGIGDRFSRKAVMVGTDLLRAALFLAMAVPGVPLPVIVVLVAGGFFLGPAFSAAMVSRLAASLPPDRFRAASGIRMITSQVAQVAGFAVGGVVVSIVAPRASLAIDAATFALSALIVACALRDTPTGTAQPAPAAARDVRSMPGPRLLRDPVLRSLVLMTALAGFFVVPEGLAVPVTHHLDQSSRVAGLLLAAGPLGSAVGAALLIRFVPRRHGLSVARAMAVACGLPLIGTALTSTWELVLVLWALSGAFWAFQVDVATALVHSVVDAERSRTVARVSAVLLGVQGIGVLAFGALGSWIGASRAVSVAGVLGFCAAVALAAEASRRRVPASAEPQPARHAA